LLRKIRISKINFEKNVNKDCFSKLIILNAKTTTLNAIDDSLPLFSFNLNTQRLNFIHILLINWNLKSLVTKTKMANFFRKHFKINNLIAISRHQQYPFRKNSTAKCKHKQRYRLCCMSKLLWVKYYCCSYDMWYFWVLKWIKANSFKYFDCFILWIFKRDEGNAFCVEKISSLSDMLSKIPWQSSNIIMNGRSSLRKEIRGFFELACNVLKQKTWMN